MLSSENIFLQPHREADKIAAAQAHKNFASHDGDLPTLVSIYDSWIKVRSPTVVAFSIIENSVRVCVFNHSPHSYVCICIYVCIDRLTKIRSGLRIIFCRCERYNTLSRCEHNWRH